LGAINLVDYLQFFVKVSCFDKYFGQKIKTRYMGLDSTSSQNAVTRNPFFSIEGSRIFIDSNGEKVNLNFDQITNVRLIKKRNVSSNRMLIFIGVLFYFDYLLFFGNHFLIQVASLIIIISVIISFLCTRPFSYKLLVNIGVDGFNEFLVPKKYLAFAQSFVFIFKDKKGDKAYTHSSIFNYVA
jgi:hypothetical protein